MASSLKVNRVVPSTGTNIGLGTASGEIRLASTSKLTWDGDTNTYINHPSADTIAAFTAGSERLRIKSDGKVGIGTDNPSTDIHLYGDAPVLTVTPTNWQSGLRLNVVGLGYHGSNNQLFRVQKDGTTKLQLNEDGDLVITGDDNAELKLKCGTTTGNNVIAFLNSAGSTKGNIFYDSDNNFMVFKTDGTAGDDERLRITSDGDIGINESSPDNMLHVTTTNNTGYSTATSNTQNITNALLKLQNLDGGDGGGVNNYVGIHFAVANGATSHAQLNYVRTGDNSGKFSFKARNGNGSVYPNLMDITSAGYIKTPNQPIFMAYRVSNYDITTTATAMVYTEEKIDVGGNYDTSNGRFTAPVDGIYEFGYASIAKNTTTVYRYDLRINGSIPYSGMRQELRYDQSNNSTQYASNGEFCLYIQMTAGQYAQVYVHSDSAASSAYGDTQYGYTYFRGRLIG